MIQPSLLHGEMGYPTLLNLAHDEKNVLISGKYYKIQNQASGLVDSNPVRNFQCIQKKSYFNKYINVVTYEYFNINHCFCIYFHLKI